MSDDGNALSTIGTDPIDLISTDERNTSFDDSVVDNESIPFRHLKSGSVTGTENASLDNLSKPSNTSIDWNPGFWARFPFLGILALVAVVCSKSLR